MKAHTVELPIILHIHILCDRISYDITYSHTVHYIFTHYVVEITVYSHKLCNGITLSSHILFDGIAHDITYSHTTYYTLELLRDGITLLTYYLMESPMTLHTHVQHSTHSHTM